MIPASSVAVVRAARRRPRRRLWWVVAGLAAAVIALFWLRVLGGDYTITFGDFWRIVFGKQIPGASFILTESKLPRACESVLVGLALGVGGAIFQTTLRNPLASPDVIGVSMGASAAAVLGIVVWSAAGWGLAVLALVGAVGTSLLVRFLAGANAGQRLVLVGVTVAAGLGAIIQYLFTRADVYDAQLALRWMTGSVSDASWPTIRALTAALVVLLPATALAVRSARALELGDEVAAGLGVGQRRADALLLCGVLLVASATAAAGPVSFVAFVAGPIARALNGGRATFVGAALVGGAVTVAADYVGAYAFHDVNLPVGVVTGAFGAPFLLWLLTVSRRSA
ncbi:iron chelate uptake ABC transporter family permease subunit [Nocardioides sp. BP30]|uniref:FecCD family ABC transporter permease n=1 Tax=Nocardioides sp. BP30 TaxID=3036374 RepID=UPI0024683145|nr:iron chelate uptake ABC transporter family permease subunit [Nocardioides sp. BP30]WGL52312.1 iron chelate uptake ABC transporter family permease subunit [Nocardioides sp. BP30]